uniref:Phospholipase A2 group V n=1 Tax=Sus scrofa TaxID=9823 RepID=A0A8D0MLW3_PIG
CCWVHDYCYAQLEEKGCNTLTQSYKYRVAWGLVTCAERGSYCQTQLCTCDQKFVYCLKRNRRSYNPHLQNYWRSFCKTKTLVC